MTTASGPEPSTASIRSAFPPTSCATSSARCISESPTSISSTAGSRASTPVWRAPIRPAPSSPTFILSRCYWSAHPASTGVGREDASLASDAVPEVRGGCFVEKQYGVGVIPQHRGWHALGDVVLHGRGHGPCLVRTRCEEQNRLRVEDGSHADRDRTLRSAVCFEVGSIDLAGALGELYDAGARVERRSWLVEAYMAVAPDPEHAYIDPTGLPYGGLVALALCLGVDSGPVRDEDPRRVGVDELVEMLFHIYVVARPVIRRQPKILVEVEEVCVRERKSL